MKPIHRTLAAYLVVLCLPQFASAQEDKQLLAKKVHDILRVNCYRCHGQDGIDEGGFNYALDAQKLVSRRKVVPGDAAQSRLYKRLTSPTRPMPPEEEKVRPGKEEIDLVRRWIEAGAPAFEVVAAKRPFVAPVEVLRRIHQDLTAVKERERRFLRYFTLTHLYNAGLSEDELQSFRHGVSKLVNSLSWGGRIVPPEPIDPEQTIFRIDLRWYDWTEKTWDALLAAYPFGVAASSSEARLCAEWTDCKLPWIRGDWFVAAACRPPLYHEILRLPATERELETLLHLDVPGNVRQEKVIRAGFNSSGVSRNNRLIERHESGDLVYWKSYDFGGNVGRQNLFAHPLGPGDDEGSFLHDGGEVIFTLPNQLHAYLLVDGRGKRIDKGPQTVVSDPKRPDRAVENGISCMSCHARGLLDKHDQVRDHVLKNPNAFARTTRDTILALYAPRERFAAVLEQDTQRFRAAVARTGAPLSASEPIVALTLRFEAEMDLALVAAEAGVRPPDLLRALDRSPRLAKQLGPLRVEGGTLQRQVFASVFPELVRTLRLGEFLRPRDTPHGKAIALGDEHLRKKDLAASVAAYTEAIKHEPDNPVGFLSRGDAYRAKGEPDRAVADFTEAIRLDPDSTVAYHNRAAAYHDKGDLARAIADYGEVLRLDPRDPVAFNNRGYAFFEQTEYARAVADYTQVRTDSASFRFYRQRIVQFLSLRTDSASFSF